MSTAFANQQSIDRMAFHATFLALAFTGLVMMFTGSDLGPYGPMLIALGIYMLILAVVAEGLMGGFKLVQRLRARPTRSVTAAATLP